MKKVLVVEDNPDNQDLVTRFLRREGYVVILAEDGVAGIEKAKSEIPDLILMDLSLPRLDGWEATRQIKADPTTSAIPVIALTAHAYESDAKKALEAGCDAFETKPVMYQRLMRTIDNMIAAATGYA